MKKVIFLFFAFLIVFSHVNIVKFNAVFATPENTLNQTVLAEKLLIKLQNTTKENPELEKLYLYLDVLYHENTQFYSYKIEELENLMESYRQVIINTAREYANNSEYKNAVEYLENKSNLFKDKSTINSLITHYSKFFVKDGLVYCEIPPKIITLNKLIAYPLNAFNENINSENYDKNYITNNEFKNLLQELYLNDYMLINISDIYEYENEKIIKKDLYLPSNKKPLILLFNNINYYQEENPFIDKFIIDSKNKIACFNSKQTEKEQISYNTDFIPILEEFISNNKNFSFNNAKALISINKSGNVLGYDISKNNPNYSLEIQSLKKIVSHLKELGYQFSYVSFIDDLNNNEVIETEFSFIQQELFPIFSNLKIFVSNFSNKLCNYYYKLNEIGFNIFIDFTENNYLIKNNMLFLSSLKLNGEILRNKINFLDLNKENIYDHNNRTKLFDV
ncbi:MAG: hypothetical protein E7359_02260 [Clostridiales bacterium]|nr:hypothetical protein [Clostridiales bacterium]